MFDFHVSEWLHQIIDWAIQTINFQLSIPGTDDVKISLWLLTVIVSALAGAVALLLMFFRQSK